MTRSNLPKSPEAILNRVLHHLSEEHLHSLIDVRIDQAVTHYLFSKHSEDDWGSMSFLEQVGDYVVFLYREGLLFPREIQIFQGKAEAVQILEQTYGTGYRGGYEAAFLDAATLGDQRMLEILLHISGVLMSMERKRYIRSVLVTEIELLDWSARRELAKCILTRMGGEFTSVNPGLYANLLPELILEIFKSQEDLNQRLISG